MFDRALPVACGLILAFVVAACEKSDNTLVPDQDASVSADEQQIRNLLMNNEEMLSTKNLDGWLEQLDKEAIMMPPESEIVPRDQTREVFSSFWQDESMEYDYDVTIDEIGVHGGWAYARWHYVADFTNLADGTTVTERAKELTLLKRQNDGSWKFSHIMWNLNEPFDPVYSNDSDE